MGQRIKKVKKRFCACMALLLVMMTFADQPYICAAFQIMTSYAGETIASGKATPNNADSNRATPGSASPANAVYSRASSSNAVIGVFSENESFLPGDEIVLNLEIQNTSDTDIVDASLTYKAKGIEDDGYFEEMDRDFEQSDPESEELYEADPEELDLDDFPSKLTGIQIGPGEIYRARFCYKIPDDAKAKSRQVDFKLAWNEDEKHASVKKSFYYNIGGYNLEPVRFPEIEEEDSESRLTRAVEVFPEEAVTMEYFLGDWFLEEDDAESSPSECAGIRSVAYEITTYDVDLGPLDTEASDSDGHTFGLRSLCEIPENCEPDTYYGTIIATINCGRRSFKSSQDFKFTVSDEAMSEALSCTVNGVEIRIENPEEAFEGYRLRNLSLNAEELVPQEVPAAGEIINASEKTGKLAAAEGEADENDAGCRVFRVQVTDRENEVQPVQPADLVFNGVAANQEQARQIQLYQLDRDSDAAVVLASYAGEEGEIKARPKKITTFAVAAEPTVGLSPEMIRNGLKDVIDFTIFARQAEITSDMEGNIAVQELDNVVDGMVGNSDDVYSYADTYTFTVKKTVKADGEGDLTGTYWFGIYQDKEASRQLGRFSITTDRNGYGEINSGEIAGLNLSLGKKDRYYIYELDGDQEDAKPILNGASFENGSLVQYEDTEISASLNRSYVERFGEDYLNRDGAKGLPWKIVNNHASAVTFGPGYRIIGKEVQDSQGRQAIRWNNDGEVDVTISDPWEYPEWDRVFSELEAFSQEMASYPTGSSDEVRVVSVKADASGSLIQPLYDALNLKYQSGDMPKEALKKGIQLNDGQCLLINVDCSGIMSDAGVEIPKLGINGAAGGWNKIGERVLWNIFDGDGAYNGKITCDSVVYGTVLAPAADIKAAEINGAVYARVVRKTGNGEIHKLPFLHTYNAVVNCVNTISGSSGDGGGNVSNKKQIDFLNDGQENPDTSLRGEDFYRLYLDVTSSADPVDVLFLIDNSGSMEDKVGNTSRISIINSILKNDSGGIINMILSDNENRNEDRKNRVSVTYFSGPYTYYNNSIPADKTYPTWNKENNQYFYDSGFSYYGASSWLGDAWVGTDWVTDIDQVSLISGSRYGKHAGTNLHAGLLKAEDQLNRAVNGRKKVMVVLTDGVPTFYVADHGLGQRKGNGIDTSNNGTEYYKKCIDGTTEAIQQFKEAFPDLAIYSVGIGSKTEAERGYAVKSLATDQGGSYFISDADASTGLKERLKEIFEPVVTNVVITDQLSQYVDFYEEQPDVRVTMRWPEKTEKWVSTGGGSGYWSPTVTNREAVIWTGTTGAGGSAAGGTYYDSKGVSHSFADIIDQVTYEGGTISAFFVGDYELDPQATYTLAFNVQASQQAYDEYEGNQQAGRDGYNGVTGDPGTDFVKQGLDGSGLWETEWTNQTSSERSGFYSNTKANVTYVTKGNTHTRPYDKPVIQVHTNQGNIPNVKLPHKKQIDYLGDNPGSGKDNPDTSLDDPTSEVDLTDLYRLYLDISADAAVGPLDVVLVIDNSNSMQTEDMKDQYGNTISRAKAVVDVAEAFAYKILNAGNNRISVVGYSGIYKPNFVNEWKSSNGIENPQNGESDKDAWVVSDWIDKNGTLNLKSLEKDYLKSIDESPSGTGTNITRGLWTAADQMRKARSNATKYMIFLSDGLPTFYYLYQDDFTSQGTMYKRNNNTFYYSPNINFYKNGYYWKDTYTYKVANWRSNGYSSKRFGSGTEYSSNVSIRPTEHAIEDFKTEFSDVNIFTLGIEKNDGTTLASLMKKLASDKDNYYTVDDREALLNAFDQILHPETKDVVITDYLSRYVEFYGEKPDVRVTMKKNDGSETAKVLWEGNESREIAGSEFVIGSETAKNYTAGTDVRKMRIIDRVTYAPSADPEQTTGTVKVVFNPEYILDSDYTYTLSFNGRVTQAAYDEYREDSKQYLDEKDQPVAGDENTDYKGTGNETSSLKPGYHSNLKADVTYTANDNHYHERYDHPAVQVKLTDLEIEKQGNQGNPLNGAKFLLQKADAKWQPVDTVREEVVTLEDGKIRIEDLKAGRYLLTETEAPPGYMKLESPIKLDLTDVLNPQIVDDESGLVSLQMASDKTTGVHLLVKNRRVAELPATGGPGDEMYRIIGLLMMAVGVEEALRMSGRRRLLKGEAGPLRRILQSLFGMDSG